LLRQKVEYLEQVIFTSVKITFLYRHCLHFEESASLADKLVERQVALAEESDKVLGVTHEMYTLRELNCSTQKKLEEAFETIRELSSKTREDLVDFAVQVDDHHMIEHIHTLQQELVDSQVIQADMKSTIKDLKNRILELESTNKRLQEMPPDNCIANLQEELIAVKMREAEANLSLKELRQKITELDEAWKAIKAFDRCYTSLYTPNTGHAEPSPSPNSVVNTIAKKTKQKENAFTSAAVKELEDQLMCVRIREADTLAELKEMRQRVMELETQNHVCSNQIRRQDDENKRCQAELQAFEAKEKEYHSQLTDERRKTADIESQLKELSVVSKVKEAELLETIAELNNKLSSLESNQLEKWTREELSRSLLDGDAAGDCDDINVVSRSRLDSVVSNDTFESDGDFNSYAAEMTMKITPDSVLVPSDGNAGGSAVQANSEPRP
uniref:Ecotropic viral integration site 5-like protein n=1 Tax=Soboliphyme baturini TaxID=241478 RepID=A0A183IR34_9BILA